MPVPPSLLLLGEFGGGRRGVIRVRVGEGAKHLAVVVVAEMGWELSSLRDKEFSQKMLLVSPQLCSCSSQAN